MADPNPPPLDLLTLQTLYLCGVAYEADVALMPALIEKTHVPPGGGVWRCLWGPAQNSDEFNLVFVAGYFPDPNLAAQSIYVTIRGTDVDLSDIWGILEQIWRGRRRLRCRATDAMGTGPICRAHRIRHARRSHDHREAERQWADVRSIPDGVLFATRERERHHGRHRPQSRRLPRHGRCDVDTHPAAELSGRDPADHVCGADRGQPRFRERL